MSSDDKLKEIYGNSNYPKWWINMDEQNTKKEKHIVKDTRKRSVFKAITGRALEILIGTFLISFFNKRFCCVVCTPLMVETTGVPITKKKGVMSSAAPPQIAIGANAFMLPIITRSIPLALNAKMLLAARSPVTSIPATRPPNACTNELRCNRFATE